MIVLDASALVDVVARTTRADWVLRRLTSEACAPAHQTAEVLSAMARIVRAGALTDVAGSAALDQAFALEQDLRALTPSQVRRALALQDSIRVLDGLYVALAEELDAPLLTTDQRLARSVTTCEVWAPAA